MIRLPLFSFCIAFCLFIFGFSAPAESISPVSSSLSFSADELVWIKEHPVIRIAPDPDFPPLEFFDKQGVYRGIAADFIHLLEKKLPLKFEIVSLGSWNEAIKQAKSRQIDMFGAAVPTPERLKYMRFTKPFVEFPAVVLVRDSAENFPNLSELQGKRVAVVSNYADHEYMVRTFPDIPLDVMPDISSGLRQLSFGKVEAMVLNLASASYYIQKDGISNLKVTQDTDFVFDLSFAVRSDWPLLISILEKGMAEITPAEKKKILSNWISLGNNGWKPSPLFLVTVTAVVLLLIVFVILQWNRQLKSQVRERTLDLENELGERIQAEKEKEKLQQQVYRAKKMEAVGLLAGGVAHDLNNILAGSVGYADLLMRKISSESPLRNYLYEIRESGRRAAAVVADLLTISRDAASERTIANLNRIVEEYMSSPEQHALAERFTGIEFQVELEPDLYNILCSETHVKKSLMNLVINAAEATQSGIVKIKTANKIANETVENHTAISGKYVLLSVADNGPGISQEDREHIFEPFYTKKKFGHSGTGLGLAVVWNTVQEHQGVIEIEQPEEGSRFVIFFPASDGHLSAQSVQLEDDELQGNGEHILVIDDELSIRIMAAKLLTNLGYQPFVVSSGEEAVEFLRTGKVDLLLLDMLMEPGMGGYQTYRQIKEFCPEQKALIASGFSESVEVKKAQELGAGAYIKKPYTLQELGVAIKKELQR
ncbi:MAG: transporter substrate-binding domain-containing protein [Desulfuromusa sp.]|jgi:signal transduction histidine kinase/ActR/RegA family two-component response regulator|nr:transporter substrate-binding domain-containing protein [Desulfuromusa sp.]